MKIVISKKTVIIGVAIILYMVTLPLALHFSGAFKTDAPPDLNTQWTYYEPEYKSLTENEKEELLANIGFDIQAFEDAGFKFTVDYATIYTFGNGSDEVSQIILDTSDENAYSIRLKIYMPDAELQAPMFMRRYERREVNGKPVGFYEPSDRMNGNPQARYFDEQTGIVYYIEPLLGFNEPENEFLKILVS